jgi:hypothetical protein
MSSQLNFAALLIPIALLAPATGAAKTRAVKMTLQSRERPSSDVSAFWRDPGDIRTRDLFYGPGGEKDQPHGPFTFLKEDLDGTNPKFSVRDRDGVKWKVKLGEEARPETTASRLVWAAGYFADEDYFLRELKVEKMPAHLHRGQRLVSPDGSVHNVRLKREPKEDKKTGQWAWADDPFSGTREWYGLRVMMALINNWDLKDENNAIREIDGKPVYLVSDLGASFGSTGWSVTRAAGKGNLKAYEHSRFITRVTTEYVNFADPTRPALIHLVAMPEFIRRVHLEWIGKRIPITDVRWMGQLLARLSDDQIQAAFRAAGYETAEAQKFSAVVEKRIGQLNRL